jgi:hypothetical protein
MTRESAPDGDGFLTQIKEPESPAANFAKRLMLPVSNDTLLRVVRRRTAPRADPLTVVGVDDWAFRRNRRYGTIVCDLERRTARPGTRSVSR